MNSSNKEEVKLYPGMEKPREAEIFPGTNKAYERRKEQIAKRKELEKQILKNQMLRHQAAIGRARKAQRRADRINSAKKIAIGVAVVAALTLPLAYQLKYNATVEELKDNGTIVETRQGSYSPTGGPEPDVHYDAQGNRIDVHDYMFGNNDSDDMKPSR